MVTEFTPITAFIGGCLIGLSALILMLASGRVAGCSGILTNAIKGGRGQREWRILFIIGLILGPVLAGTMSFELPSSYNFSWPIVIIAGLVVGVGTSMANGCTSGHGICGIGRLSKRSITATCVFMAAAIITVYISRHVVGG